MNCIVTAGPTHESLDQVRRLTNFSTGRLGTQLAGFLADSGHSVTLLRGEGSTCGPATSNVRHLPFGSTDSLLAAFRELAAGPEKVGAVFHAAAVSDFRFGQAWERGGDGTLTPLREGKLSTRQGTLLAELVPTPKLIPQLRGLFPEALLVGWKYEVDGGQAEVIAKARDQIQGCRTDACVANGPAYGAGFAWVTLGAPPVHLADVAALLEKVGTRLRG